MMNDTPRNLIPSGVEPVDKLLGGLEDGQLYLVHGEAAGKSLFGIEFLIEGLKRGENGALIIRYSPEDAVRRFARLGYDPLEDVYSGRLVILEYSDDIIQQISRLKELTPVLRELEWLLGETRPHRLIFDPVASLVLSEGGDTDSRAREFADWARSFGAAVVLVANGDSAEVVESFKPIVSEVFRFELRETARRATRFLAFEKSQTITDQAIEVDPSRGIFLLGRAPARDELPAPTLETFAVKTQPSHHETKASDNEQDLLRQTTELEAINEGPLGEYDLSELLEPLVDLPLCERHDDLSQLIEDLGVMASPLDLDISEIEALESYPQGSATEAQAEPVKQTTVEQTAIEAPINETANEAGSPVTPPAEEGTTAQADSRSSETEAPRKHNRAADLKIDSAIAARAAELLLRPPDTREEPLSSASLSPSVAPRSGARGEPVNTPTANPKDFNILIIDDDPESCEQVAQALNDYRVEVVHDGMSGLAKLISFKPDLVVLDVDLPLVDGFKVLAHIRSSLNMPIIVVSGTRVRAGDRVMSAELGADYFLTKPFSFKELQQKARQLIARYRGINSWIVTSPHGAGALALTDRRAAPQHGLGRAVEPVIMSVGSGSDQFTPYDEFASEVERKVHSAMDNDAPFSIVGCRLPEMTANGGRAALKLFETVSTLVRDTDLISTNSRNDLVILLVDADTSGARAFISRLRERVLVEMNVEPSVWLRSFPELEESEDAKPASERATNGNRPTRRAGDDAGEGRRIEFNPAPDTALNESNEQAAQPSADERAIQKKPDPRESYIDFLEQL